LVIKGRTLELLASTVAFIIFRLKIRIFKGGPIYNTLNSMF